MKTYNIIKMVFIIIITLVLLVWVHKSHAEVIKYDGKWLITYYCACEKCCGKWADGTFASGRPVYNGGVACNILPLGTELYIEGLGVYTVEDRGAKSLFDNKQHIDVYMDDHDMALQMGRDIRSVLVFEESV